MKKECLIKSKIIIIVLALFLSIANCKSQSVLLSLVKQDTTKNEAIVSIKINSDTTKLKIPTAKCLIVGTNNYEIRDDCYFEIQDITSSIAVPTLDYHYFYLHKSYTYLSKNKNYSYSFNICDVFKLIPTHHYKVRVVYKLSLFNKNRSDIISNWIDIIY